jgi:hypothetical protein
MVDSSDSLGGRSGIRVCRTQSRIRSGSTSAGIRGPDRPAARCSGRGRSSACPSSRGCPGCPRPGVCLDARLLVYRRWRALGMDWGPLCHSAQTARRLDWRTLGQTRPRLRVDRWPLALSLTESSRFPSPIVGPSRAADAARANLAQFGSLHNCGTNSCDCAA